MKLCENNHLKDTYLLLKNQHDELRLWINTPFSISGSVKFFDSDFKSKELKSPKKFNLPVDSEHLNETSPDPVTIQLEF